MVQNDRLALSQKFPGVKMHFIAPPSPEITPMIWVLRVLKEDVFGLIWQLLYFCGIVDVTKYYNL